MENKIREYFNQQLYPFLNRINLDYNNKINTTKIKLTKSNKPDVENWIKNGFIEELYQKLYKTSGYGEFHLIIKLLNISINVDKWLYKKYIDHLDHEYFIEDSDIVQRLKNIFYYINITSISDVCFVVSVRDFDQTIEYFSNIKIYKYNSIDIDNIPKSKFNLFIVDPNIWINSKWGLDEYLKQQLIFRYIIVMFNLLKDDGTFIINIPSIVSNLTLELLTLVSSCFKEVICFKSGINTISNNRNLIFKQFKRNITDKQLSNLTKIAKEWEKYEPSIGTQLNLKNRNAQHLYSNIKQFKENENDHFVKTLGIKIDPMIQKKFKEINQNIQKDTIKNLDIINNIYEYYATHKSILKEINHININYTIQYCKMLSITLKNPRKVMQYYTLKPLYFPVYNFNKNTTTLSYIDLKKIKMTTEGEYSVTFPVEANIISNLISNIFGNDIIIMDGTANVGGNTISFSRFFNTVISIEINKKNYEALENNVSLYNIKNVELIHGNTLDYLRFHRYDVLFLDPPWGGVNYKRMSVLDLKLGHMYVRDIIVLAKNLGKMGIVLKLPKNFRITEQFLVGDLLSIYRIKNYFCAIIRL